MWESLAAFGRDFSKQLWESALGADFHSCGISIRPVLSLKIAKIIFASFLLTGPFQADRREKLGCIALWRPDRASAHIGPSPVLAVSAVIDRGWRSIPHVWMEALLVVKAEMSAQTRDCGRDTGVIPDVPLLELDRAPQPLAEDVVEDTASASHAASNASALGPALPRTASALSSFVSLPEAAAM